VSEQRRERAFDATLFGIDLKGTGMGSRERGGAPPGPEPRRGGLAEVAVPLFVLLTTFRRNARSSQLTFEGLRSRIDAALSGVRSTLSRDARLRKFEESAWYVLVVTADQVVLSSEWKHAPEWRMRLLESEHFKTATGGEEFFRVVERVLSQSGEDAAEMAELLFLCMGLGFQGALIGDSRQFEQRRTALYDKAQLPAAMGPRLTPAAYDRNEKRTLMMLPRVGLARVILVAGAVLLVLVLIGRRLTGIEADKVIVRVDGLLERLEEL